MGAGFIIGGFCPGTSVCAAAIGKIDAMVFVVGIAVGIFGFGELYPMIKSLYLAEYLGQVKLSTIFGISQGVLAFFVIIAALLMFWIAEIAEKKFPREEY
jgi:hypothetical protein